MAVHRNRRRLLLHLGGIYVTPKNLSARYTSALAQLVAHDLALRGWRLEKVTSDNAAEFPFLRVHRDHPAA